MVTPRVSYICNVKALTLLEYLIRNGSERVSRFANDHIHTLQALQSFHYIDEKNKDQGINVRQRSKEIVQLLSDPLKLSAERERARVNRNKYTGVGAATNLSRGGAFGSGTGVARAYSNRGYESSGGPYSAGGSPVSARHESMCILAF